MMLSTLRVASCCTRTVKDMSSKLSTRQFEGTSHSQIYAKYRPVAPSSILDHILAWSGEEGGGRLGDRLALDVGCGSGQFTRLLLPHFSRVLATDVSQAQVEQARGALTANHVEVMLGSGEQLEVNTEIYNLIINIPSRGGRRQCGHGLDMPGPPLAGPGDVLQGGVQGAGPGRSLGSGWLSHDQSCSLLPTFSQSIITNTNRIILL